MRAAVAADDANGAVPVWREHWAAVCLFLACSTQWRVLSLSGGMAPGRLVWLGLDYQAVRVVAEARGVAVDADLWDQLQVLEAESLKHLNARDAPS